MDLLLNFTNSLINQGFAIVESKSPGWLRPLEENARIVAESEAAKYAPQVEAWLATQLPFLRAFVGAADAKLETADTPG